MSNPDSDGVVNPVRIEDIHTALQAIEEWIGTIKSVLGRLDPEMEIPDRESVIAIKRNPCPIPIVDGGLCKNLYIKPAPCPDPKSV